MGHVTSSALSDQLINISASISSDSSSRVTNQGCQHLAHTTHSSSPPIDEITCHFIFMLIFHYFLILVVSLRYFRCVLFERLFVSEDLGVFSNL